MSGIPFSVLYSVCLALCVGLVESLKSEWTQAAQVLSVPVMNVVAIPPRPQGARPVAGAGERVMEADCRSRSGSLRDVCFTELARSRAGTDLEGALSACEEVSGRSRRMECMAASAEVHAPTNRAAALAVCPRIAHRKWSDQCVFGIALALVKTEPVWAFDRCGSAGMWRDFCRHDVNGEIALMDVELSMDHCTSVDDGELASRSCWHGIGKYLGRADLRRAQLACGRVPSGVNRDNCIHGLGWAGAEGQGLDFAAQCDTLPDGSDPCRLGVAYQQLRVNPEGAAQVCRQVAEKELRFACEQTVTGSRG